MQILKSLEKRPSAAVEQIGEGCSAPGLPPPALRISDVRIDEDPAGQTRSRPLT